MTPTLVNTTSKGDIDKRSPLGAFWLLEQIHSGFVRKLVSLAGVAGDAGADDILPGGLPSTVSWQDMIDIEMAPVKMFTAVLAGIFIPFKNIESCEFDLFFW